MRCLLVVLMLAALPTAATAFEDPDTEVAKKHFEKGRGFYDSGDYAHALDEFLAARRAKPAPALDFNIARCLDRLERYHEAIAEYEAYLEHSPKAADRDEVRTRVNVLRQRLDEIDKQNRTHELATTTTTTTQPQPPPNLPTHKETPETAPPTLIPPPSLLDTAADRAIKTEIPAVELEREKTKRKRTIAIVVGTVVGVALVATGVALGLILSQPSTPGYTMTTLGNVPSTR